MEGTLAPFPIGASDSTQVVVFALLLLGWIIKTVLEKKQKPEARRPGTIHPAPVEHPHPVAHEAPRRERMVVMSPEEASGAIDEEATARASRARLDDTGLPSDRPDPEHGLGQLAPAEVSADAAAAQRRGVLKRLGGDVARSGRDLVRAGMLWSEVLGPPRSLTGPHASPTRRRARERAARRSRT